MTKRAVPVWKAARPIPVWLGRIQCVPEAYAGFAYDTPLSQSTVDVN